MAEMAERTAKMVLHRLVDDLRSKRPDLPKPDNTLLDRLLACRKVVAIFDQLEADGHSASTMLRLCLEANAVRHSFDAAVKDFRLWEGRSKQRGRQEDLSVALQKLQAFVDAEVAWEPTNWIASGVRVPEDEISRMKDGLVRIRKAVDFRGKMIKETALRIGATRKTQGKAADTAAIGWLAEGVQKITSAANEKLVAQLAEIILGSTVTAYRVHAAVRTRKREWRQGSVGVPKTA